MFTLQLVFSIIGLVGIAGFVCAIVAIIKDGKGARERAKIKKEMAL